MNQVTVSVPATTANLGVGFDCIGAALSMANEFTFTKVNTNSKLKINVTGDEAYKVSRKENNLIYQAFLRLYQQIGKTPPNLELDIKLEVPLSRGLGSSATAIVGGLLGANALAGNPLERAKIIEMAIAIEGHPDNVVPALLGNCQLSVGSQSNWQICSIPWHQDIIPVVAIPNFELSTKEARSVLPNRYTRSDAIFNISRMGLLLRALETHNQSWLKTALADKIHQPYRQQLITGYFEVQQAAIAAGAYGMVISGAGPTLLALTNADRVDRVVKSMAEAWKQIDVEAQVRSLSLDTIGAKVQYADS
ncbi:homoserine kinase [Pleurocapsa sp. FMAR1]|uniref:homoserine kinase n=1 Tax=Pleurocapsa sp. FMAR1 TaxID=3040204 RepID=UPI0029C73586|nr:homoserine kinase [Pleurocapsa sp. FMAR1]